MRGTKYKFEYSNVFHLIQSVFVILFVCSMHGCSSNSEKSIFTPETVYLEAKEMLFDYHTAVNETGLVAEFDFLDSSHMFFWVPPGFDKAIKYEEVKRILLENAPLAKGIQFEWEHLEIFPLTSEIATYYGIVKAGISSPTGLSDQSRVLESGTLIKRKDGWKLLSGQSIELK